MEKPIIENYKLGKGVNIHDFVSDLILFIDQLEAGKKALTPEELLLMAKKVVKLADNMINTFETMKEDQCWEMAIMAALSDNQFREKELILPNVNVALPICTNCHKLMQVAAFECSCGVVKKA